MALVDRTTDSLKLDQILDYLHGRARLQSEVIGVSPFTLYLHLSSRTVEDSVALPNTPFSEDVGPILSQVDAFFANRRRMPRIQFLDRQCPGLEESLSAAGYELDEKFPMLGCVPGQLRMPERTPPISVTVFNADSPDDLVAEGWMLNTQGFNGHASTPTADDVAFFRRMLGRGCAFSAHVEDVGVGAGMFNEPLAGVTEIAGITTLPPFRGLGIASALTATITASAFEAGATLAFLVAASPEAGRIYLRLGYEFYCHLVTMIKPLSEEDLPL